MASAKIKLMERDGTIRTSLTNINWAWFDSTNPSTFSAPSDKGSTESTDVNGYLEVSLPSSTLTPGQAGTLVILSNDTLDSGVYVLEVY